MQLEPSAPLLSRGDAVGVVAPGFAVRVERLDAGLATLRRMGFRTVEGRSVRSREGYFAGSDAERLADLNAALRDPGLRAIWFARGGYGTARLLERVDWRALGRHPKILIGFSDLTALHLAVQRHAGLVTFHSPNPQWGLGSEDDLTPFSAEYFWKALEDEPSTERGYTIETDEVKADKTISITVRKWQ